MAGLFTPALARVTILLTLAYLAHVGTFYFMMKWVPKIVTDEGFQPSVAASVLVWTNAGGTLGSLVFSLLTRRFAVRTMMFAMLLLSAGAVAIFGSAPPLLGLLCVIGFAAGVGMSSTVVGFYATIVRSYPVTMRASGVGFVIGVGRAGSALSPLAAGAMFAGGFQLPVVAAVMACGSALAIVCLVMMP